MSCFHDEDWRGVYRACPKCEGEKNRIRIDRIRELTQSIKESFALGDTGAVNAAVKHGRDLGEDLSDLVQHLQAMKNEQGEKRKGQRG